VFLPLFVYISFIGAIPKGSGIGTSSILETNLDIKRIIADLELVLDQQFEKYRILYYCKA